MLRYLAVLAVLAVMLGCFMGDVSAVTDQEFQDLQRMMDKMVSKVDHQASELERQNSEMELMSSEIHRQAAIIKQLQSNQKTDEKMFDFDEKHVKDLVQNLTVEERVELLEIQVVVIQDEVSDLETNVDFLFGEQLIQDERLLNLEEENDQTDEELDQIEDEIENLQVTTIELDFRVTELEENGGSGGNSSISELEERVETLEGTAADHETRIASMEIDVEDLEGDMADHETRLAAAEENIQGLQMTDINHDARISALEENETIAFHAVLSSYDTIPNGAVAEFNEIVLNEGNGYDNTTGIFTVPLGGDGVYYFSTYLLVPDSEHAYFDMELNDDVICSAFGDHFHVGPDNAQATCSAVVRIVEGDEVKLVHRGGTDDTPLRVHTVYYYNGFNGFRI